MLIDLLSENEIDMISSMRNQNSSVGFNWTCDNWVTTDEWLRYWEDCKESFLAKPFINSNSLILKKTYKNYVDNHKLESDMFDFVFSNSFVNFQSKFYEELQKYNPKTIPLDDPLFFEGMSLHSLLHDYIFQPNIFIRNCYEGPKASLFISKNKDKKIDLVKGCKIIKIIGKIAKELNMYDEWEQFRIKQSQILNQAKIDSTICLSIHPLDYLTASLNNNNWRSCMHWEDGEYRRGVVEMMNSEYVVVAYLESNSEVIYPGEGENSWNSKKWREFFIVNKNFISGIKGYPYWNKDIEAFVLDWLRELYTPYCEYPFSNNIVNTTISSYDLLTVEDPSISISCKIDFYCGPAMYNDFYSSYDNYYSIILSTSPKFRELSEHIINFSYSGVSECVCCGKIGNEYDFNDTEALCCNDCLKPIYCCKCGDAIYSEEDLIYYKDRAYCYGCYDDLPICSFCDEELIDFDLDSEAFEFVVGIENPDNEKNCNNLNTKYIKSIFKYYPFTDYDVIHICENCIEKVLTRGFEESRMPHKIFSGTPWREIPVVYYKNIHPSAMEILFKDNYMDQVQKISF